MSYVYSQPCHQCPDDVKFHGNHFHDSECGACGSKLPTPHHHCRHADGVTIGLKVCENCKGRFDEGCWEWCHLAPFEPKQREPRSTAPSSVGEPSRRCPDHDDPIECACEAEQGQVDARREHIRQSAECTAEVSAGLNERLAADDRRERYADAIFRVGCDDTGYAYADAAMAVADEEIRVARMETAQLVAGQYAKENARLRDLLEEERHRAETSNEEINRLRAELEDRRDELSGLLSEVRAYVDDMTDRWFLKTHAGLPFHQFAQGVAQDLDNIKGIIGRREGEEGPSA